MLDMFLHLYKSSEVSQLRLRAHSQVKEQRDVDGSHRNHVDDVQRMTEELLSVRSQQQPRHHLEDTTKHC